MQNLLLWTVGYGLPLLFNGALKNDFGLVAVSLFCAHGHF